MLKNARLIGLLAVASSLFTAEGLLAEESMNALEQQFRELPMEARRLTGPLFWLHGDESRERLEMYVGKVAEGGNGCFTTESRPHKDWLGEGWYRDLDICLHAAKKHNLKMWIFDEKWWPSGEVGGKVPAQYGSKRLTATAAEVKGPQAYTAAGYDGKTLVAVIAGKRTADGIDGNTLMNLTKSVREGQLKWEVPAGDWSIMKFTAAAVPVSGRYLVDGASQDSVDWYIRTVFQPHYDRFKDDFGKTILGFFYDEPETHGDWGTEVIPLLKERGGDWKKALVAFKFKLAGEQQVAARYQYMEAFAEAWGRTMYGGITRWCEQHGVRSIGHWLEHTNEYVNPNLCAGNMFQVQKYSSMGGIDAVFDQFRWGQRAIRDIPCWQTPKLGSSITHAYGKPQDITMVEIFGARGQDLSYPEMKWWTDHMQVSGVNFMIPHSFNPRSPYDTDCPPYFYNGGFEPRWPLYRVYADWTSRLSVMLAGGRHVCPVALLYLGQSAHAGKHVLPDQMSEALQDALYDCDWLPYDVFEEKAEARDRQLQLREESYRVLVAPAAEVIPYATLLKIKEFYDRGGVVVGYGLLPSKSATLGKSSADIVELTKAIWGDAAPGLNACKTGSTGGRSYFLPEKPTPEQLQGILAGDAGIAPTLQVLEGDTDRWLHVLHRVKAGRDLFFVTNQNLSGGARRYRLQITAQGEPECWDAMRNEATALAYVREGKRVVLSLTLEPNESVLLVFQERQRPLPVRGAAEAVVMTQTVLPLPSPPVTEPVPEGGSEATRVLETCSWMWYPDETLSAPPPGVRCFRKSLTVPADRKVQSATFTGTADNSFILYVNGKDAGRSDESGEGWRNVVQLDARPFLAPGRNQLALAAFNTTNSPSPAGLIGKLVITFEQGEPLNVPVDATWKAFNAAPDGWNKTEFDDRSWVAAKHVAPFGGGVWGRLGARVTLSPVKANPFIGRCELVGDIHLDPAQSRLYLEVDAISPEEAARVTINDQYAGGFIGRPLRLEVTRFVKIGSNTIRIEPFAPSGEVRLRRVTAAQK